MATVDDGLNITVSHDGKQVVTVKASIRDGLKIASVKSKNINETIQAPFYRQKEIRIAGNQMKRENLQVEPMRVTPNGYELNTVTENRFEQIADETLDRIEDIRMASRKIEKRAKKGKAVQTEYNGFEISDEDVYTIADTVAAFETGTITAEQINELNYENTASRQVFKSMTGIDLAQYTVKRVIAVYIKPVLILFAWLDAFYEHIIII